MTIKPFWNSAVQIEVFYQSHIGSGIAEESEDHFFSRIQNDGENAASKASAIPISGYFLDSLHGSQLPICLLYINGLVFEGNSTENQGLSFRFSQKKIPLSKQDVMLPNSCPAPWCRRSGRDKGAGGHTVFMVEKSCTSWWLILTYPMVYSVS